MLKLFEKMKEGFNKFCEKTDEMFSKMKKPKKQIDIVKLMESPSVTTNYKFIDLIEVPYKGKTYDAELWWNNKDGSYLAKTLPVEAQRFDDLKATIVVKCPVRSRKKVEQMMTEQIDKYFKAERSENESESEEN